MNDDEGLLEALLGLRAELDVQEAKLGEARARLESLPHRQRYLLLTHELGMRLIETHREWLDHVEHELRPVAESR